MDKDFQDLINDRANKEQKHARKLYKRASLATGYGQTAVSLSADLNITVNDAQDLIDDHKRLYPQFWKWTEYQTEIAPLKGFVITPLGWRMRIISEDDQEQNEDGSPRSNDRTLLNWPMQSGGSDIMRLFVCMAVEAGYKILCTVHDAMLAECDAQDVDKVAEALVKIMEEASWVVLGGKLTLRTGVKKFVYPDRYIDEDGEET